MANANDFMNNIIFLHINYELNYELRDLNRNCPIRNRNWKSPCINFLCSFNALFSLPVLK